MTQKKWFAILAISYARDAIEESHPGRKKWLMERANRYRIRAQQAEGRA